MNVKVHSRIVLLIAAIAFTLSGCMGTPQHQGSRGDQSEDKDPAAQKVSSKAPSRAFLVPLKNQKGKKAGEARLMQTPEGLEITVEASHLKPGTHAIHFHETAKCETPDFKSAGGHFNPYHKEHGLKNKKGPHAGDLENIIVEENGTVQATVFAKHVTLEKWRKNSLLDQDGSALVIHSNADDNHSQPSGDAGDRVLCGEIDS